jgi:ABC-type bacteriocin/lantibiotic exporter with double-glycine peptidase domain
MEISTQFTNRAIYGEPRPSRLQAFIKAVLAVQQDFNQMGDYLHEIAAIEKQAFTALSKIKLAVMSMPPAVSIQHAGFKYPKQASNCINDLSLEIKAGESFGLFGPNGAGKTTLMHLMTRTFATCRRRDFTAWKFR